MPTTHISILHIKQVENNNNNNNKKLKERESFAYMLIYIFSFLINVHFPRDILALWRM